jgi:hypothetical protein
MPLSAAARSAAHASSSAHWSCSISSWHCLIPFHYHGATFETERLAVNEGVRHFPPGLLDNAREGRAGNLHLFCGLLLVQAVQIRESQGFEFVQREDDFLQHVDGNARRFEVDGARVDVNVPNATGSRHGSS